MEVQIVDLDECERCKLLSISFSKKLSARNGWSAGTGNFNHWGKWQMEHSFFFVFYQSHIKPTSSVHDMNFVKTNWGTCFLIFLRIGGIVKWWH